MNKVNKGKILGTLCKSAEEGNGGEKSNEEALWHRQERLTSRVGDLV